MTEIVGPTPVARLAARAHALSPDKRREQLMSEARAAFERHELRRSSEGRWSLHRKLSDGSWDSIFWIEVIVLAGGKLLVHGDIEHVLFAYYSDRDPLNVVRWMGQCRDIDYYVHQKATIGTGRKAIDTDDDRVAAWQLAARIEDEKDQLRQVECMTAALAELAAGEHLTPVRQSLAERLGRAGYSDDWEWIGDLGTVPDARLYYAHAGLQRLCVLLGIEQRG